MEHKAQARPGRGLFLRLGKCWQGATHFVVWQLMPAHAQQAALPKKFFLQIDCHQANRGLQLCSEKAANLRVDGPIAALLRKYVPGGGLSALLLEQKTGALWLPVQRSPDQPPYAYLHLSKENPPVLSLILDNREQIFRYSQSGTYTHRKQFSEPFCPPANALPSDGSWQDLLPQLLAKVSTEEASPADDEPMLPAAADVNLAPPASESEPAKTLGELQRQARDKLARREKTARKALSKQEAELPSAEEIAELGLRARLLQSYGYLVQAGSISVRLEAALTGLPNDLDLSLDPELSVGQNVEHYFSLVKKKKKALALGEQRLHKNRQQLASLQDDLARLRSQELPTSEVVAILKRHQITLAQAGGQDPSRSVRERAGESLPYKIFRGREKQRYLVGKGPSENDVLTKAARSNDFWLHVMTGSGSHVIVPSKTLSQGVLDAHSKREAAILALHYSKLRGDNAGDVYVTQRRNLRKTKGLAVGLWLVDKSEAFFVRYTDDELQGILARMEA